MIVLLNAVKTLSHVVLNPLFAQTLRLLRCFGGDLPLHLLFAPHSLCILRDTCLSECFFSQGILVLLHFIPLTSLLKGLRAYPVPHGTAIVSPVPVVLSLQSDPAIVCCLLVAPMYFQGHGQEHSASVKISSSEFLDACSC